MKKSMLNLIGVMLIVLFSATFGSGAEKQQAGEAGSVILSDATVLRTFMVERTPVVIGTDGEFKQAYTPRIKRGQLMKAPIGSFQSPLPEDGWRGVEFDDAEWARRRVPVEKPTGAANGGNLTSLHYATSSSMICARARFLVQDPQKAGDLRLSVTYVGGLAVFLNGKELKRHHLPEGELKPDTLAEKYPDDLYITADGKYLQNATEHWNGYKRDQKRFARRYRHLRDFAIPASMLRKGLNVLALQVHRAPVSEAAVTVPRRSYGGMRKTYGLWAYVALTDLALTARSTEGVLPNLGRRRTGIEVWNCRPFETLTLSSFGDPGEAPGPIEIDAVRNGAFSGRFVISSDKDIENLKVEVSELTAQDGKARLDANAVRLRHGRRALAFETPRPGYLFDGLLPGVPARVPFVKSGSLAGAVLPVWITVEPPKDAVAGLYTGTVTVQADGLEKIVMPVRCTVHCWTLPDPIDYRVKNLNTFGPYWVAKHYKVPLWSDKHFALMEKSFCLMAAINGRRVDVDMVPGMRYLPGNSPRDNTMFQLVQRKDGKGYDYDFSVIEKMLDLVEKTMKSPLPLQVNCWGDDRKIDKSTREKRATTAWVTSAKYVQVLDPTTGKLSYIENPPPGSEENYKFWKPILVELRKRIEKRGWYPATAFGHQSYCWAPSGGQVKVAKQIWPDCVYTFTAHSGTLNGRFGGVPVRYSECVWTQGRFEHRGYRRLLKPGRDKSIWNSCSRDSHHDSSPLAVLLLKPEEMIMRGHDGLGYLCADFLPVENPNPKARKRYYQVEANSGGIMGTSTTSILAAGPDGPVATGRYEMFREGVQQCEAIFFLQRALDAKKIGGDLAAKVNRYLDERSRNFLKRWHYNRRASDRRLLELAARAAEGIGQ